MNHIGYVHLLVLMAKHYVYIILRSIKIMLRGCLVRSVLRDDIVFSPKNQDKLSPFISN